ncbi:MAG: MFS transporter [Deltaproteobacteria bacterium]|nr:MFS transporter [Deltaproteobacteria bacterium]
MHGRPGARKTAGRAPAPVARACLCRALPAPCPGPSGTTHHGEHYTACREAGHRWASGVTGRAPRGRARHFPRRGLGLDGQPGAAGDLLGHRRVYLAGTVLLGAASLGCALSVGLASLVAARVAQGIAGAMVMATSPALLTSSFPPSQRGRALGTLATATYAGLTVGPPIGGWVVAVASWRWVFLVNVPSALLVGALGWWCLPRARPQPRAGASFDWAGVTTLVCGLPLVLVALAQGHRWGWSSWRSLGAAGLGLFLLGAFAWLERRPAPLLDLRLFRSALFAGAVLSALGNYVALFVPTILLPFFLTEALGLDASHAGMLLSAQPLMMAIVASPSGRLSDRIGSRGLATAGLAVLAVGIGGLSTVGGGSSAMTVAAWLAVMGLGTGIFISPNSSALMGAAPPGQQGSAGAVMAVARTLGMMIGVATGTSIFVAAGGSTGHTWTASDIHALHVALVAAAAVCLLSAAAAALRGGRREVG